MQFIETLKGGNVRGAISTSEQLGREIDKLGLQVAAIGQLGFHLNTVRAQHVALAQALENLYAAAKLAEEARA